MDTKLLTAVGLSPSQAEAYALLIEQGEIKPPDAAKQLNTSRTNAYKVFDKLVELGLANKTAEGKMLAYAPANPLALANLSAQYRAEAVAREEAINQVMRDLLAKYHEHSDKPSVNVVTGRKAVAEAYRTQINLNEDIYFIHTKADVASMGFDTMHEIRVAPARRGHRRFAIMAADEKTKPNWDSHRRSNLDITWFAAAEYQAPVEWSVTNSTLLIVLYGRQPHAILIEDKVVAAAFLQLWRLLSSLLRAQPLHQSLKP